MKTVTRTNEAVSGRNKRRGSVIVGEKLATVCRKFSHMLSTFRVCFFNGLSTFYIRKLSKIKIQNAEQ